MSTKPSKSDAVTKTCIVGGVGNRVLPADTHVIERNIGTGLRAIATDAGVETDRLILVVSAAEGADRLLIKSASRLGVRYECVLPCSPECFSEDFSSRKSVQEFEALLARADAVASPEPEPAEKLQGYFWVNHYILSRADVLLAVWDGSPGNGPAGTAHTIDLATGRHLPVLWIPTNPPDEPVRLESVPCELS